MATRVGRPTKKEITSKTKGSRGAVGRPKGDAAIMNEYKARMIASPKSRKVQAKIFEAALDDDHKHQAVAWKLVMDRVLPTALFDEEIKSAKGARGINITINGVQEVEVGEVIEHE